MNKEVICATGNEIKFKVIEAALAPYGITLIQQELELNEIQASTVDQVALATARSAYDTTQADVMTTDAGCAIEALKGFPGPYIKYVNQWFTVEDYLRLMQGVFNRNVIFQEAIGCCKAGAEPVVFVRELHGTLSERAGAKSSYTPLNEIFIPQGFDRVSSEIPEEEIVHWAQHTEDPLFWQKVADYFIN